MEILYGLMDIPLWLLLLLLLTLLLYTYGTWTHSTWSDHGIPGPTPFPLIGNTRELLDKTQFSVYTHWQQKYGRVFGYYFGVRPILVVTELDLMKEILVKRFSNFADRNFLLRTPVINKGLFFVGGTAWKRIRAMMTPTFSTSKLKLMSHFINRCSALLSESVENKASSHQDIDVKDVFGSFTMDVIAGTAFGLETDSQTQEGEPFVRHCKALFGSTVRPRVLNIITSTFPFIAPLLGKLLGTKLLGLPAAQFLVRELYSLIDDRHREAAGTHEQKPSRDMLQMLVEAEADSDQISDSADRSDGTKSHKRMTREEMVGQGFIVLIAGYETTATTLQYLTYNLTLNPDTQDKVFREIMDHLGDADPTYENVASLKYLDAAIRETLRLFPPVAAVDRRAREAVTVKGVRIPAGCGVLIPIYSLMHDPLFFHDPETFIPDRFLEENRASVEPMLLDLPFGYGPRQCIGMRLALLEIKFAAVRLFRRFRFLKCPDTPEKITLGKSFAMAVPDVPIKVKAEIRAD